MKRKLFLDIETFSDIDLMKAGLYRYAASPNFEIMLIGYALDNEPTTIIDLSSGDEMPSEFISAMNNPDIVKVAHNAAFERTCFRLTGLDIPTDQWECTMVKAAYMGLPFSLDGVTEALDLNIKKLASGKALINYFTKPCKPTITNRGRTRNGPFDDIQKWESFREYLIADVDSMREMYKFLENYSLPEFDKKLYVIDQAINDIGIKVNPTFVANAISINEWFTEHVTETVQKLTGLANPNSPAQLKTWLSSRMKQQITSLTKDSVSTMLKSTEDEAIRTVLESRQQLGKSSIAKYQAMSNSMQELSHRIQGVYRFYGANATGRWSSLLVQLQNLPRNSIPDLDLARNTVLANDGDTLELLYGDVSKVLSQLIRTAIVPDEGKTFIVSDFSSIESRVISWYANEEWRLDVFKSHGKIYEATASKMFNVPFEEITKDSPYRQLGKVAELALGFGGSVNAITVMDFKKEIPEEDKPGLVRTWRNANPNIVKLWHMVNATAIACVKNRKSIKLQLAHTALTFSSDGRVFSIVLPSSHVLNYWQPRIVPDLYGRDSLTYMQQNQVTRKWQRTDTYGGKLVENIVQATARDILGETLIKLDKRKEELDTTLVMHVHDEVILEAPTERAEETLTIVEDMMSVTIPWAPKLNITADGFITSYYKKD